MRVESSVTTVTWIPSEAISGMPKLPFEAGIAHYDEPPPDRLADLDELHRADAFREANELRAFIDVDEGEITNHGHLGRALIGVTRLTLAGREIPFKAVQYPVLRPEPQVGDGWVRFVQTAGGHMGLPAPRMVRGKPFFRITSSSAWTTLALTLYADGRSEHELIGASPFPRHFVYDDERKLVEKSGVIDFKAWYRESHGGNTPWGEEDSPALVTQVESELEREIGETLMQNGGKPRRQSVSRGETLVQQGDEGRDVFLVLDGIFSVEIDGEQVAELGPGAIAGERAAFEGGRRTATLMATTPCRVAVFDLEQADREALAALATSRREASP
jgi:cyclic nucleotide-binding protein